MKYFDSKTFNSEVFLKYLQRIPDVKKNELLKSGVLVRNPNLKASLSEQVGGNYVVRPYKGLINGNAVNYDGQTDIDANTSTTYKQGMIVVGRAAAFTEKDFSFEVTGVDFMSNVASQLAKFWEDLDQDTMIAILNGIFGIEEFAETHIYEVEGQITATTINSAVQKACGDRKNAFSVAIMHSVVATQLENLQILEYLKYTDKNGVQRSTALATVNGKLVLIDDSMPVEENDNGESVYTTYILGAGAFEYEDVGVKVPVEMDRDPKVNGGEDTLYSRQRKVFAPAGFSFNVDNIKTDSPTDEELSNSENWSIITDASGEKTYPLKAIPICAVKSLG